MKRPSKLLQKNKQFLRKLPEILETKGFCAINNISCCQMKCLSEIFRNLILGNIPLNKENYAKLKPHKKLLTDLSDKKISLQKKKKIFKQEGAGVILPVLISAILPSVLEF